MQKLFKHIFARCYGVYFNFIAFFCKQSIGIKAFKLFSTPRKGKVLSNQATYLKQHKGEVIQANNTNLQTFLWPGKQETVLLIHGWESNTYRWKSLIGKLQESAFNVIAFDAPGHGYSEGNILSVVQYAENAQVLIKKYQPKYIIGHSMGGFAAIHHQYQYPNSSVEKIVALAAFAELSELLTHYQHLLKFNTSVLKALERYFYEHTHFRIKDISTPTFAKTILKKGLIIHDEEDTITPFSAAERIHNNWKNSRLIKTKGLGHSLHNEDLYEQIVTFLKS